MSALGEARVLVGDCLDVLRDMPASSVDAVVTDPPYELGFMGKKWDASGIAYSVELWRQVLRVLRPGGHLLAFGGTRTSHRMVCAIEDAGFDIRDSLVWMYGSGFPKSLNVGKAIDEAAGATREVVGFNQHAHKKTKAPQGSVFANSGPGLGGIESALITAPATPEAAKWEGWGTALKPAHEPIVLARKPLTGTVAANVQAHGTGALNVDGCRIESVGPDINARGNKGRGMGFHGDDAERGSWSSASGRWPANVVLDEESARLLDEQSGWSSTRPAKKTMSGEGSGSGRPASGVPFVGGVASVGYLDSGGASRFFYVAKADRAERDDGLGHLPSRTAGQATDREEDSAGLNSPRAGAGRTGGARNFHPTVKPVSLCRWLCRLITPPAGLILDPFCGSGTTGVAAQLEGFRFIGIEREAEYAAIANERLNTVDPLFRWAAGGTQ